MLMDHEPPVRDPLTRVEPYNVPRSKVCSGSGGDVSSQPILPSYSTFSIAYDCCERNEALAAARKARILFSPLVYMLEILAL